jgi:hypothetical protein
VRMLKGELYSIVFGFDIKVS